MKKISDIVSLVQFNKYQNTDAVSDIDQEKTKKVLNGLFIRFENIFPGFWVPIKSQEHLNGIKDEWFEAFKTHKLFDIDLLKKGLRKARESDDQYLPKPIKFIKWCTEDSAQDIGLPDLHHAFQICGKINELYGTYNHPHIPTNTVLKHVIKQIGSTALRKMTEKDGYKVFGHYYVVACRDYSKGIIQDIPIAIEENKEPRSVDRVKSDASRLKCMQDLKALGLNITLAEDKEKEKKTEVSECVETTYKKFDENKIKKGHREFNPQVYNEYREYLLSIPETQTLTLPITYIYDRRRFLNAIEQPSFLRDLGYVPKSTLYEKTSPRGSDGHSRGYKHWNED